MKTIQGNILEISRGIICHQVNAQGVMGAGLALQIYKKFPTACISYLTRGHRRDLLLEDVIVEKVRDGLKICHAVGQESFGSGLQTDYHSWEVTLPKMALISKVEGLPLCFPYKVGCGLAGGDWTIMESLLEKYVPEATIYRFEPEEKI